MDTDNLGPAPDLDNVDFSKLDFGNDTEPKEPPLADTSEEDKLEEELAPESKEAEEEVAPESKETEEEAKEEPKEEQPRDEKSGKFKKKEIPDHVPRERMNEAVGKEREAREQAEKRAAELERQLREREATQKQQVQRNEQIDKLDEQVTELEKAHAKFLLDGEAEKAAEAMKEIRQLNRQVARLEAQEESSAIVSQTLENERLGAAIAKWEAEYPELNPQSESYDRDLIEMILPIQASKVQNGMPPSQALNEAVAKVMGRLAPKNTEPEKEGLSKAKTEEGKQKAEERKQKSIEKAISTQNKQPAQQQSIGLDSDKAGEKALPNVDEMSMEDFAALPEATRARLRGDLV